MIIAVSTLTTAACIGAFFGVRAVLNEHEIAKYEQQGLSLPDGFTVTAHTGCEGSADNSLESVRAGVEAGAGVVEFDLNFAGDGSPVLTHDSVKGGEVMLAEAFNLLSQYDGLRANMDVKAALNLGAVQTLAEQYGVTDRIFYTGIGSDNVNTVKKDSPNITYYLNVDVDSKRNDDAEYIDSLVKQVTDSGAIGINMNYKSASEVLVKAFHENGLLVSLWTVDKELDMHKMLSLAPDNITTREPKRLMGIIEKRGE